MLVLSPIGGRGLDAKALQRFERSAENSYLPLGSHTGLPITIMERRARSETLIVIVMGVTGAGKTTVGVQLAQRLGWDFADADDFHTAANVEKMRRGIALDDADRAPWLN